MNSGQPPPPQTDSAELFCQILRLTLQLKIKANSWKEFRPTPHPPRKIQVNPSAEFEGQLFSWKLRLTLQLKIKANSWNEFRPTPLPQEDSGEPFCWILRPTLQLKIKANSWTEN